MLIVRFGHCGDGDTKQFFLTRGMESFLLNDFQNGAEIAGSRNRGDLRMTKQKKYRGKNQSVGIGPGHT